MLFQSDYWFASNPAEKKETILDFLETDDGIKTLIIVDKTNITYSILNDLSFDCSVTLITETDSHLFTKEAALTKTIYVRKSFRPLGILNERSLSLQNG